MAPVRFARKHKIALLACLLVAVYAVVLVTWVGNQPATPKVAGLPPAGANPIVSPPAASNAPSVSPSGRSSGAAPGNGITSRLSQGLPKSVLDADPNGLPRRRVQIRVTSDGTIAGLGYIVAHGHPARYNGYWLKSPVYVSTVGRSGTLVAFVVAQAGPDASYVTCTLTVDGVVRSQHTAHGAYQSAACIG